MNAFRKIPFDVIKKLVFSYTQEDKNRGNVSRFYDTDTILQFFQVDCSKMSKEHLTLIEEFFGISFDVLKSILFVHQFEGKKGHIQCQRHYDTEYPSLTCIVYDYDEDKCKNNRLVISNLTSKSKEGDVETTITEEMPPKHVFKFEGDHYHYAERDIQEPCVVCWISLEIVL